VAGIDVGEDFLDIATLSPASRQLSLARVDLRTISAKPAGGLPDSQLEKSAVTSLRLLLADTVPELRGAMVLVDSPRWPSDLDWSKATSEDRCGRNEEPRLSAASQSIERGRSEMRLRGEQGRGVVAATNSQRGRKIDAGLRALVFTLRRLDADSTLAPLSMFPTPPMRYFGAHLNIASCKPHLRSLGRELFGEALNRDHGPASGGIFTRFMIAGFATFRALETIASEVYECYPDLQFKLWRHGQRLSSKNSTNGRKAALASRVRVLSVLARKLGIRGIQIKRMDEADAAILALSTIAAQRQGATLILQTASEGSFLVAMDRPEAQRLQQGWKTLLNAATIDPHHNVLEE
jgi:predicted nuclease with RNAse H fold